MLSVCRGVFHLEDENEEAKATRRPGRGNKGISEELSDYRTPRTGT